VGEQIVFGLAAAVTLVSAVAVITLRNAFRATVALIGALIGVAAIFLIQAAPFVAAIQVIVYAGAIVVLFLFVVAYLGERGVADAPDRLAPYMVFAWIAGLTLLMQGLIVLLNTNLPGVFDDPRRVDEPIGDPEAIGHAFLDDHLVPFEATSLVLLVGAVGAVILAKRAILLEGGR